MTNGETRRSILWWAREVLHAETKVTAGQANLYGLGAGVLFMVGLGLADIWQIFWRIFQADYTTGLPSLLSFFRTWGVLVIACVFTLGATEVFPRR